ncbi:hypothetical protein ACVIU7_007444 [Bradyrhizobium liaoningense]
MGLVDGLKAQRDTRADEVAILLEEDIQHRSADQFRGGVAQLRGAERVHVDHGSGRIDHEVHDRGVLEDLLPLLDRLEQVVTIGLAARLRGCGLPYAAGEELRG